MKNHTCPNIPALKEKMLANLVTLESAGKKPTKKHRDAAVRKLAEIVR